MILCDTNVLIEFYKGNPAIVAELKQIGVAQLAISAIAQAELYYGALASLKISSYINPRSCRNQNKN